MSGDKHGMGYNSGTYTRHRARWRDVTSRAFCLIHDNRRGKGYSRDRPPAASLPARSISLIEFHLLQAGVSPLCKLTWAVYKPSSERFIVITEDVKQDYYLLSERFDKSLCLRSLIPSLFIVCNCANVLSDKEIPTMK